MPKAFVHGVPENTPIWADLFDEFRTRGVTDLVALSPPGFGTPVTEGFEATRTGYRSWLIDQLIQLGGHVDLVGHDWGALHLYGVLEERPDLIRTWAADMAGTLHADYVWHDHAQAWQTPGVGEDAIKLMFGLPLEEAAQLLTGFGIPIEDARAMAAHMDETMGNCVLNLYRSAAQPEMSRLGQRLTTAKRRPGLMFIPTEDPFTGTPAMCESMAEVLMADVCRLEGSGHWWMFTDVAPVAEALLAHWEMNNS